MRESMRSKSSTSCWNVGLRDGTAFQQSLIIRYLIRHVKVEVKQQKLYSTEHHHYDSDWTGESIKLDCVDLLTIPEWRCGVFPCDVPLLAA